MKRYFMQKNMFGSRPMSCPREHLQQYFDAILDVTGFGRLEAQEVMGRGIVLQTINGEFRFWSEEARCTDCHVLTGGQHRPSCHRQGIVTLESDYTWIQ